MPIIDQAALKAYMNITDTADDVRLATAAASASRAIVDYCGRTFDKTPTTPTPPARQYRPARHSYYGHYVDVDDFWETTVLAVTIDTSDDGIYEQTWTLGTDYYLEPLNGLNAGQPWPWTRIVPTLGRLLPTWSRRPPVNVVAAWGWAAIPDPVTQAALIKGARIFQRRDSPEGVASGFSNYSAVRVTDADPDVCDLLYPYRTADSYVLGA